MRQTYQTSSTTSPFFGDECPSLSPRSFLFTVGLMALETIERLVWSVYDMTLPKHSETKQIKAASGKKTAPDEIKLFMGPWVPGTKSTAYFGPIGAEAFVDNAGDQAGPAWEKAELEVMGALQLKASELGANSVVSVERTADPWALNRETGEVGLRVTVVGMAALLVRVF